MKPYNGQGRKSSAVSLFKTLYSLLKGRHERNYLSFKRQNRNNSYISEFLHTFREKNSCQVLLLSVLTVVLTPLLVPSFFQYVCVIIGWLVFRTLSALYLSPNLFTCESMHRYTILLFNYK